MTRELCKCYLYKVANHDAPATTDDLLILAQALSATNQPGDQADEPASIESSVRRVEIAFELKAVADGALREAISDARSTGVPWQVIGDALGITRQAAFQRFGHPINTAGAPKMKTEELDALIPRSEGIYHHLAAGEYTAVGRQMTFVVQRLLHEKKVMGVWSQVTDDVGTLQTLGESFARPSGDRKSVV